MNNLVLRTICFIVIVFGVQQSMGLRIKCYTCDSRYDSYCNDPFKNSTALHDCSTGKVMADEQEVPAYMCRKTRTQEDEGWIIKRDCCKVGQADVGESEPEKYCSYHDDEHKKTVEYYLCYGEPGCNGAPSQFEHSYLLFVAVFFMFCGSYVH